ncbi:MAG: amino acid ABC transporter substrate-binding protein [Spartobacteria bacterium]|nr:amino acid ABC transporter substrate-binding protein [Spartobacteria bacterium]
MIKKFAILLLMLLCAGCATQRPAEERETVADCMDGGTGILRIGVCADNPPMVYVDDGVLKGIDVDLARKLCRRMGKNPEFVQLDQQEMLPALTDGRVDVLSSSMSMGRDWKGMAMITDPYMDCGQVALVRRPEASDYDNVGILLGAPVIGVIEQSRGQQFASKNCRKATILECADVEEIVQKLIAGTIDVALFDLPVSWWLAQNYAEQDLVCVDRPITEEQNTWMVAPENEELLLQINEALDEAVRTGVVDRLLAKLNAQEYAHP